MEEEINKKDSSDRFFEAIEVLQKQWRELDLKKTYWIQEKQMMKVLILFKNSSFPPSSLLTFII